MGTQRRQMDLFSIWVADIKYGSILGADPLLYMVEASYWWILSWSEGTYAVHLPPLVRSWAACARCVPVRGVGSTWSVGVG